MPVPRIFNFTKKEERTSGVEGFPTYGARVRTAALLGYPNCVEGIVFRPNRVLKSAAADIFQGFDEGRVSPRERKVVVRVGAGIRSREFLAALAQETATGMVAGFMEVDARLVALFAACLGPWPADFSILVRQLLQTASSEGVLTLAFASLAEHLDPAALPGVEDWLTRTPTDKRARRRTLRGLANALTIRQTIQQEFT